MRLLKKLWKDLNKVRCLSLRELLVALLHKMSLNKENIFHTRCTVSGKVCSLIIDGGSCTNATSKTPVEKLKLSVSPHPSPHTIQWLNQGKGLQITSCCLLTLSNEKNYKDEI